MRTSLRWGGAIIIVLLLGAWIGSRFHLLGPRPSALPLDWWFQWNSWSARRYVAVPLWLPALGCILFTIAVWRHAIRTRYFNRAGRCPRCGYELAGLVPGSVCPECGTPANG